MSVLVINGPNLNLLGTRQPDVYGSESLADIIESLKASFPDIVITDFQSNHEGEIIDCIQQYGNSPDCTGIIINPGAFAHYSYAIADAISAVKTPVVEVHISNIMAREEFRRKSVTASSCMAMITGAGAKGYALAMMILTGCNPVK